MLRHVDNLGRIVIPISMRRKLNIKEGCDVEIELTSDENTEQIIIKPADLSCSLCGSLEDIKVISGKNICGNCIKTLKKEL